jgi:hypothetical protein
MSTASAVKAIRYRDGKHPMSETLVIASHDSQMRQWIIRQGLRFYAEQDSPQGLRQKLIEKVLDYNTIDLYYDGIVTTFLSSGSILWYLRPTDTEDYEIHWFGGGDPNDSDTEFKAYYKPGGRRLNEVVIRYAYEDYSQNQKWIRLRITEEWIIEEKYTSQPSLYPDNFTGYGLPVLSTPVERTVQANTLKFIPCVVSSNMPTRPGDSGNSEYRWLSTPIEAEDAMRRSMLENVFMFASPSLITTRPKAQVLEAIENLDSPGSRPTWSSQQGFGTPTHPSTRRDDPWVRGNRYGHGSDWGSNRSRIARVIGNVQPEERFGYVAPDPINGDQWRFAQEYREGIHECLGGIDPLGMKAGMTFGEVKSLYGKVAATANKKCTALWTYGLAKILEMVILIEENLFLDSYRQYLLTRDRKRSEYQNRVEKGEEISTNEILDHLVVFVEKNGNNPSPPPGVVGLIPWGSRAIRWKWKGPVFEKQSEDLQKDSIVVRNQQELGVGSLQAMEQLYPDKDPIEIKKMLTGVPFRLVGSVSSSIGALLGLQQQLSGIPDPQNPAMPLAARMDLTPLIQQQLQTLYQETSYGSQSDDSEPLPGYSELRSGSSSASLAPDFSSFDGALPDSITSFSSAPISGSNTTAQRSPIPYDPNATSNSLSAAGLQPADPSLSNSANPNPTPGGILPEWRKPIPTPGGAVQSPSSPGASASSPSGSLFAGIPNIPPDLPPSIAQQLYSKYLTPPDSPGNARSSGRNRKTSRGRKSK